MKASFPKFSELAWLPQVLTYSVVQLSEIKRVWCIGPIWVRFVFKQRLLVVVHRAKWVKRVLRKHRSDKRAVFCMCWTIRGYE